MDRIAYEIRASRVSVPDPADHFRNVEDLGAQRRAALVWARAAQEGMGKIFERNGERALANESLTRAEITRQDYLRSLISEN